MIDCSIVLWSMRMEGAPGDDQLGVWSFGDKISHVEILTNMTLVVGIAVGEAGEKPRHDHHR